MTDIFEAQRPRLRALAYRMLGSFTEAEDVLQEVWVSWQGTNHAEVQEPAAFLTTLTTRRCVDVLRSARMRREHYVGPWLPEPLIGEDVVGTDVVADEVALADSVRMAFLVVLESLSPAERAAFVLHDVFGYGYADVGSTLGRAEPTCRQLVSRARQKVQSGRPCFEADDETVARAADRFLAACLGGDLDALLEILHPEVVLVTDGGGKVTAARRPIFGADRVARFLQGIQDAARTLSLTPRMVNGAPGLVASDPHGATHVISVEVADGLVHRINIVANPDKLHHVAAPRD